MCAPNGTLCVQGASTDPKYANGWRCDICQMYSLAAERWYCDEPSYDVCFTCAAPRWFAIENTPLYVGPSVKHALGNGGEHFVSETVAEQVKEENGFVLLANPGSRGSWLGWAPIMRGGTPVLSTFPITTRSETPEWGQLTPRQVMARVSAVRSKVDIILKGRGFKYSCKTVSWNDAGRGTVGGAVSCWGRNITDAYLKARDEAVPLFTIRPDNWNEKLGVVSTTDVALVARESSGSPLRPVTLRTFLENFGTYGAYAGVQEGTNLGKQALDSKVSIRFQTTFLPVSTSNGEGERGSIEFYTEHYNYQTSSPSDPKNMLLLCTTQGTAVQSDGNSTHKLLHHTIDPKTSKITRHFLEAQATKHGVGGVQKETGEERSDALRRGKATSAVIGTEGMGTRFNVLMTIQVPVKQRERIGFAAALGTCKEEGELEECCIPFSCSSSFPQSACTRRTESYRPPHSHRTGVSSAARVSKGSVCDEWDGLEKTDPERHGEEHITITVVTYYVVEGGVPSEEDVVSAVKDLEALYEACAGGTGKLSDPVTDFVKDELTVADMQKIAGIKEKKGGSGSGFPGREGGVDEFGKFPVTVLPMKPTVIKVPASPHPSTVVLPSSPIVFKWPDPNEMVVAIPEDDWEEQKQEDEERQERERKKKSRKLQPLLF